MMQFPQQMKNDLILRAARGEEVERTPVWIMRQAGRYMQEFREVRLKHDFFEVCRTPELACQVTMQPIDRFDGLLDAAIIFSDILVIPQALGLEVQMIAGKGPHFPNPLVVPADLERLERTVDVQKTLGYVFEAITLTRKTLAGRVPLIGFAGSPWTLMAYMIEGGGSKTLSKAKTWLYNHPKESHSLLQRITDVTIDYLVGQAKAGAQMLQVFDSWGGELAPDAFREFSLPYLNQIARRVKMGLAEIGIEGIPMGAHDSLDMLTAIGFDVVGLDWTVDPVRAREVTRGRVTLQGNADPALLYGGKDVIRKEVKIMLEKFGPTRHIANLGHGMHPDHDPEHLQWYLEAIRDYSTKK